ncbi:MAG TPA: hypothetical protein VK832_04735 [Burkholderiaceae bacterium]|jgi:hypothetical protein|nr:hypothetical protein [Burkholderiaceae bacterium]
MSLENYRKVIDQWCEATGMQAWNAEHDMHVDINNTTVGLIYDEGTSPDKLHVMADMGQFNFADIQAAMLRENMQIKPGASCYFALHPDSGSAVYRMDFPLTQETDGGALPLKIATLLASAQDTLRA